MTIPSLVVLAGLWGGTLVQAPPAQAPPAKEPAKVPAKPAAPSIDAVIANALGSHPEILAVEAKLAGARADVELAKLALTQKILRAKNRLEAARQIAAAAADSLETIEVRTRKISPTDLTELSAKLLVAKVQLAEAEAEWKMYESGPKAEPIPPSSGKGAEETAPAEEAGFLPNEVNKLQYATLMTVVPIEDVSVEFRNLVEATKWVQLQLLQAQPNSRKLILRVPAWTAKKDASHLGIESIRGEMPLAAWLVYIADEFNRNADGDDKLQQDKQGPYEWYIRDYGLVFEKVSNMPVGAPTLAKFLKVMQAPGG